MMRIVSGITIGLTVLSVASLASVPKARYTCAGTTNAVYALIKAGSQTATWPYDVTNDKVVVAAKPTTTPTLTLEDSGNTDLCGDDGSGSADPYFTTSSTQDGSMVIFLSSNNSKDARFPEVVWFKNTTPNPATKYGTVERVYHGGTGTYNTCQPTSTSDSTEWYWKVALCP